MQDLLPVTLLPVSVRHGMAKGKLCKAFVLIFEVFKIKYIRHNLCLYNIIHGNTAR